MLLRRMLLSSHLCVDDMGSGVSYLRIARVHFERLRLRSVGHVEAMFAYSVGWQELCLSCSAHIHSVSIHGCDCGFICSGSNMFRC